MVGSSDSGKPLGVFAGARIVRCLVVWAVVWGFVHALPSTIMAQLRSGRVSRDFYDPDLYDSDLYNSDQPKQQHSRSGPAGVRESNTSKAAKARRPEAADAYRSSREPEIVAASYSVSESSVSGHSVLEREPIRRSAARSAPVVSASAMHMSSCDCDSCDTFAGDFDTSCDGVSCDCGGMGCGTCSDFGIIAPTCSACPTGIGPLQALWCRMSVRAEAPLYWRRAAAPPPLVTTSSDNATAADVAGQLGEATTRTLLGNGPLNTDPRVGLRLTFATWLDANKEYGLMFRYWNAGAQDDTFNFSSVNFPILARPFFNTSVGGAFEQDTQLVAFPGDSVGDISVATSSSVDGLELSLRRLIYQDRFTRIDYLYGYQHVSIDEGLTIRSNTTVTGNIPGLQGANIALTDNFQTQNDFNGMSYGLMSTRHIASWKLESMFRLGLGNLRRKVNINGSTTTTSGGAANTENQGLLARNTNDQPFQDDTFVVLPEVGLNLAYYLRPGLDFNIGYNYMLIPKVAQASQQINDNLAVNLSEPITGTLDPQLNFEEQNYWLQSIGFGMQLRY